MALLIIVIMIGWICNPDRGRRRRGQSAGDGNTSGYGTGQYYDSGTSHQDSGPYNADGISGGDFGGKKYSYTPSYA